MQLHAKGGVAARNTLLALLLASGTAQAGTLTIESWRVDDKTLWETVLIPAFQKKHPGIEIKFSPTAPTEYDSTLNARLSGGTAGDLLACRPFDVSLALYKRGQLEKLDGKAGMDNFPASAKVAWQTDDGKDTFCMPIASVMHGFLYNKKIFRELKLQPPATEEEFFKVLETVKKSGKYAPLALGTADQWEANQVVFTSIGANYWKGEEGRKALIAGKAKFTDPQFVAAWEYEARLGSYLSKGASAQTYGDSQNQFALGKAAIYPSGSWDIAYFKQDPELELGAFNPPVRKAGDKCYISDHTDIGMSVNKKSKNKEDAYKFLAWLGSQEFADIYTNKVTGFFSLSNHLISIKDPLAKQMNGWRASCASTIRLNAQILNRGEPSMENELWNVNAQVLNGKLAPKDAARQIQSGFAKWYKPQQQ
ncbi:ABC transporter substrate-binding protein [Janthinobacterium lividum]|jgi:raffinose/stachyose/melibiose transport system substrate-binding protein|uniref:Probable sugar-binding periplasmic protein n=2 Tax=Janthinobacterium lividum TaxID=29581 RepID=A0AAJ4MWS9_9BURK|nr:MULTISPECIES: ABC transporter substrate-binding protein [Janthinobacterium]KAB0324595.1 carbohydrate ABC transporter substrate-binding protein [Janthinobacterium lividum]KHA80618.1 sugar ABC transporter substrate-binding protein [Janthinobacterium lividum]MBR7632457.1 carbohydrate ABC transporter substrate-binding protein [Janthinobacterium lividum]MCC7698120.1 carbohydrate ABC transporter substrate-binding protein [Janthinobacterium sp. EB271-G4-7A]MCC7712743.1 carbohydrate ABC transporter